MIRKSNSPRIASTALAGPYTIACLAMLGTACSFQVPFPPTASLRTKAPNGDIGKYPDAYDLRSPLMRRMAFALKDGKDQDGKPFVNTEQREMAVEAVWRCENRLNNLVNSIRSARDARAGIGIASGSVASAGGLATAILATKSATSDENDTAVDVATAITAGVTAVAGILTVISSNIGDPNALLDVYTAALAEYSAGKDDLDALFEDPPTAAPRAVEDRWGETVLSSIEHFNLCADPSGARKPTAIPAPQQAAPPPVATTAPAPADANPP